MIRDATAADYPLYVRLFPDMLTPDEPPPPEAFAADIAPQAFVLCVDGEDAAIGYLEILEEVGYVRQIMVVPEFRGQGLGAELMREAVRRFSAAGCERWCLNVRPDNGPAIALYRRFGLEFAYASTSVRIPWAKVASLPMGGGEVSDAHRDEAVEIERAFGLPSGLVAAQIEHRERVVRVVRDDRTVCGVACFNPAFPGCFPFRARTASHMRALLDALRPSARPELDDIQLVFEDSPDLARALESAGGRRTMDFVHYRGALPAPT